MSTAYLTVAVANRWYATRGYANWSETRDLVKLATLVKAADLIDTHFTFRGHREAVEQMRAWPRTDVHDKAGRIITGIPPAVIAANCVLALALIEDAGGVAELLGLRGAVLSERVGSVAVRYNATGPKSQGRIKALLAPLLQTTTTTGIKRT